MMQNIIMIATCLVVCGAMAGIFMWFIKRLNKIEEERWGKKVETRTGKTGEAVKGEARNK